MKPVKNENGIWLNNTTFLPESEIRRKASLENMLYPEFVTPLPEQKGFDYWKKRFEERQRQYQETESVPTNNVTIRFPETTLLNLIGDVHAGSPYTHYDRLHEELETIVNTPNSYVILFGDLVDGFFFNPAQFEQIEQAPEQFMYMNRLLDYLGSHKRLLVGYSGDHENWARKMGLSAYSRFSEATGGHYISGVGYIEAIVNGIPYRIVGAHRHLGHSIYNKAHSAMRLYRDNAEGSDVAITAHRHRKGYVQQAVREFGNEGKMVHFITLGTYKQDDDYARKHGYGRQNPVEMYGSAIKLYGDDKRIRYYDDILEANKELLSKD